MNGRDRRDECVPSRWDDQSFHSAPLSFSKSRPPRHHSGADVLEPERELILEPSTEPSPPVTRRHSFNQVMKFGQRHHTHEYTIFVYFSQPSDDARIGSRLRPLRDDVSVEEKTHRAAFCGRSFLRLISRPEFRSGEAEKKSVRFPVRFVFLFHSSTAAATPCLVMVCGPFD
jgi:hypothetical protein